MFRVLTICNRSEAAFEMAWLFCGAANKRLCHWRRLRPGRSARLRSSGRHAADEGKHIPRWIAPIVRAGFCTNQGRRRRDRAIEAMSHQQRRLGASSGSRLFLRASLGGKLAINDLRAVAFDASQVLRGISAHMRKHWLNLFRTSKEAANRSSFWRCPRPAPC